MAPVRFTIIDVPHLSVLDLRQASSHEKDYRTQSGRKSIQTGKRGNSFRADLKQTHLLLKEQLSLSRAHLAASRLICSVQMLAPVFCRQHDSASTANTRQAVSTALVQTELCMQPLYWGIMPLIPLITCVPLSIPQFMVMLKSNIRPKIPLGDSLSKADCPVFSN